MECNQSDGLQLYITALSDRPTLLEIFVFMMFIVCAEEDIAKFIYHAKKLGKCHLRQQACVCVKTNFMAVSEHHMQVNTSN